MLEENLNISLTSNQKIKLKKSSEFKTVFKEGFIFILFSFFSAITPILICIFASYIKNGGTQAVMALGYVIPFQLAVMQSSFSISTIIIFLLTRNKSILEKSKFFSCAIWLMILLGAIMLLVYVSSSYTYIYFSVNKPNTQACLNYAFDYIFSSAFFVFLFPLKSLLFFYIYYYQRKKTILFEFIYNLFIFLPVALFGIFLDSNNVMMMGLSQSITVFLFVLFFALQIAKNNEIYYIWFWNLEKKYYLSALKYSLVETLTAMSVSIFKGAAIIFIAFFIPNTVADFVPLSYQMARVIWFNMMYFIPFIGIGLAEAVRFHTLLKHNDDSCQINHSYSLDWIIVSITMFCSLLMCIGAGFLVLPLSTLYSRYDGIALNNYPNFENSSLSEFGTINEKQLKLPLLSQIINEPEKYKNYLPQNSKGDTLYLPFQKFEAILNNSASAKDKSDFGIWFSLFMKKNNFNQVISANPDLNNISLFQYILKDPTTRVSDFFKWYIYLDLYSNTDPEFVNSFINLRITNSYNNEFNNLILNNVLVFNSKTFIYVSIYSIFSSGWTILLQTTFRDNKRYFPYWFMNLVYFICITGLILFGVYFGVKLKDTLGASNPFQYIDAWTFPLVIISIFAFSIVSLKSFLIAKKLRTGKIKIKRNYYWT